MASQKIVKDIIEKKISTVLDDIQLLISSEEKKIDCSEICSILRALYQAVVPSSGECENEDTKRLIFDLMPCINLCVDHARNSYSCSDLVKHQFFPILYHIIRTFLKVELYHPAMSCGSILKTFLEDSENSFEDKLSYLKNMNIVFWNEALHMEKDSNLPDPNTVLALRITAIDFLFLDKTLVQNVNEKIKFCLFRYCYNNDNIDIIKIHHFLQSMWSQLEMVSSSYDHKAYLYKNLSMWFEILLKYLKDLSFMKHLLVWYQDLIDYCNRKKDQKVLSICSGISKISIQFFILQEIKTKFKKNCLQFVEFCKSFKDWNGVDIEILAHTCSIIYSSFATYFRPIKNEDDDSTLEFMKSNISLCVLLVGHFVDVFSDELVQKHLSLPTYVLFSTCHTVVNLFSTLLKKEQDCYQKKDLITEAEQFVNHSYSKITSNTVTSITSRAVIGYASCITRLGMSLYGSGLYSECSYFFEVGDSIFSMCSYLPDYNTEETQGTLWKLHEVFTYASFLSGLHEKALRIIVKSLINYKSKTKECFDLWRKVKRDAIRHGKESIASKTIYDFLSEMNAQIGIEREINYLLEEFKICKSERCNFDDEIIAVAKKLLNMPCSKEVRAYFLLEFLTMPLNLSEKISVYLKKSLPEICLETINLFKDHLAENYEDCSAKLYLSTAYFWLYHNSLKRIHEIAEKESQNILKPVSPKPSVGVQNDVEENDTCDIQPVHPLVSVTVENETLRYLDLSIQLWDDISEAGWKGNAQAVKEKNVLDIIVATAEIYSTALNDCKEMKLWLLLQSAAVAVGNKLHELTACISLTNLLVRLGYLNLASYFLQEGENQLECMNNNEFEILKLKFQLSKSNYFLQSGKFDEGLKIVQDILTSTVLEKRFKSVKMIHAETLLLLSEYLIIPSKAFSNSENRDFLLINSPLASLMESVSLCKALLKHFSEKQVSCVSGGLDWICFKPLLVKNLLTAHIQLGEFYFKAGDPRFARCYLQDALKIAESQILTYWSSKILLVLGYIDLMCDNFKDCQVKASGLKYILDKETKANCFEILNQLQAKYSLNPEEPLSPDSPDALIISSFPAVTLPRHIKQVYIDKIDIMSSPLSKRNHKNKTDKNVLYNFTEENFSMNLLQLETAFLFYLLSQTETDAKASGDTLQELLNYYNHLKNMKHMSNILTSIKLNNQVKEPLFRFQSKLEVLLNISIQLQKLELCCIKDDNTSAKEIVKKSFCFLESASNCPSYSYPDIYALLKYHDIRVSMCDFYKIPLNSSVSYYICPSVKPIKFLKKSAHSGKAGLENTPNTPLSKNAPKIVISEYSHKAKKCQAPLKKNLLNTNFKKVLESEISGQNSPYINFNSSEEENFESPYNSLTRASKVRSAQKKISKKSDKADKNPKDISYRFFKAKHNTVQVTDASDIWNLCLTDTPKSRKEDRRLRSAKTLPKPTEISKKKTQSANSVTVGLKTSKLRSKRSKINKSVISVDSVAIELEEPLKQNDSVVSNFSERKTSIEHSRSSPLNKICESDNLPRSLHGDNFNSVLAEDMLSSDSVFFSPSRNIQEIKIPNLIDDLCKDLSSLNLSKTKSSQVVAGNLAEVIEELYALRLLIQNCMPYPLYANICKLLAVLLLVKRDGSWNMEKALPCSFLLSEAFSVSLRNIYIGNMIYFKELNIVKEKEIIMKTLKRSDCDIGYQMESFLHVIPENWTIVQISALHNQEYLSSGIIPCPTKLIISQCRKNSVPIVVSTNSPSDEKFASNFLVEFRKILEESSLTMINMDSKSWWKTRSALDIRMKELIRDMENIWLGYWKGVLLGKPQNEERIKQIQLTAEAITKLAPSKNENLLKVLIDSAHHLSKEQVCTAVCYLWDFNHTEDTHNKLCKSIRNISITLPETERHPVILILDQLIQDLPWECIPILKGVPVSRMPSLSILHTKLAMLGNESILDKGFDSSNTYYVLNPGGDLTHSQEYFQHRFEKQVNWNGLTGTAPTAQEFISGFKDHDLLIYCGHGSGRKYFEGTSVDKLRFHATSILMGCSSGKLRRLGRVLEAYGIVLRLLLSGCPSITANLWDVTDKDIDRFTDKLLQSFVPNYDELQCNKYDVAKAVSLARNACKMRYLVGAAPVVYGFPVFSMTQ